MLACFIEDNIWTMDGDGELRLLLMATLAQEESLKTSERFKKQVRKSALIMVFSMVMIIFLGYDRVGETYVINEEQAETVRMIFNLYLHENGSMKIAKILTEQKKKSFGNCLLECF